MTAWHCIWSSHEAKNIDIFVVATRTQDSISKSSKSGVERFVGVKYISVDIETDGPAPALYSMVSFGAVEIDSGATFYQTLCPISDQWVAEALKVSGFTRSQTLTFPEPERAMDAFATWVRRQGEGGRVRMIADNAGFDWSFINYYFHRFVGDNPFGWSCISLTSLYNGYEKNMFKSFKGLRKTKHSHNALDDAKGNAEVIQFLRPKIKGL